MPFVYRLVDVKTHEPLTEYLSEAPAKRDVKYINKTEGRRRYKVVKVYVNADGSPTKQGTSIHLVNGQLLFRTRAAALKYARANGAKKFSIRKLKRG